MACNSGGAPAVLAGFYPCPECGRAWVTAQACRGHMAMHSRDANRHRRNAGGGDGDMLRLLAPNPEFWAEYRRGGRRPGTIAFLGLLCPPPRPVSSTTGNAVPPADQYKVDEAMGSLLSLNVTSSI